MWWMALDHLVYKKLMVVVSFASLVSELDQDFEDVSLTSGKPAWIMQAHLIIYFLPFQEFKMLAASLPSTF